MPEAKIKQKLFTRKSSPERLMKGLNPSARRNIAWLEQGRGKPEGRKERKGERDGRWNDEKGNRVGARGVKLTEIGRAHV